MPNHSLLPSDPALSGATKIVRIPFSFAADTDAVSPNNTGLVVPILQLYGETSGRRTVQASTTARAMRARYLVTAFYLTRDIATTFDIEEHELADPADITDLVKTADIQYYDSGTIVTGTVALPISDTNCVLPFNPDGWFEFKGGLTITSADAITGGGLLICREYV